MSSALRKPATRDSHTKYFIVLQNWGITTNLSYYQIRSPNATASVSGIMSQADFIAATSNPLPYCSPPNPTSPVSSVLFAGNVLKDLGSVVRTYDQLGQPGSNIFRTYRLVQLMIGTTPPPSITLVSEGAYGNPSNFYNTYWICTEYAGAELYVAPVARIG